MAIAAGMFQKSFANGIAIGVVIAASTLSACGGGDGLPCGGAATLTLDVTYQVNGVLVDPTRTVLLTRGQPVVATPQVLGLPSACASEVRWTYRPSNGVPPGLAFDSTTGRITGTPTALASFNVQLQVEVNGYPGSVLRSVSFLM